MGGEEVRLYIPRPLPPDPALALTPDDLDRLERANRALGRLDGVAQLLPDPDLFLYFYVRKEAVLSSQIEGTQSSLSDLLLFETDVAPGVPLNDVQEVSRYVAAIESTGSSGLHSLPLSLRLIREIHGKLLAGGRGGEKDPGEFRRSQNWIGGSRPGKAFYVPPPPERLMEFLDPPGEVHPRQAGQDADAPQGRARPCPVREHPPFSRRQWPRRPPAHHPDPLRGAGARAAASLPQPLLQAEPNPLLRPTPAGPH